MVHCPDKADCWEGHNNDKKLTRKILSARILQRRVRLACEFILVIGSTVLLPWLDQLGKISLFEWRASPYYYAIAFFAPTLVFALFYIWADATGRTETDDIEIKIDNLDDSVKDGFKLLTKSINRLSDILIKKEKDDDEC
jgi:hypothetical protein